MPVESGSWVQIAGGFPPKLVTNNPERALEIGETPNCTNISPTAEGFLQAVTAIPSVDTRTTRSYTIGGNSYEWHYRRAWRFTGSQVIYNAPDYTTVYLPQGDGYEDLNEIDPTSSGILKMLPLGGKDLAFLRAGGTHVLINANDLYGQWFVSDMLQEVTIANAAHADELDGEIYYVNADSLFKLNAGLQVEEIGFPVRGGITPAAVTTDYNLKLVRIGDTHIYDANNKKIFKYNGSTFVYETPQLAIDNNAISVTEVEFHLDNTGSSAVEMTFQVQFADRGYGRDIVVPIDVNRRDQKQSVHVQIPPETGKSFQLKITDLPTTIKLTGIWAYLENYVPENMDS